MHRQGTHVTHVHFSQGLQTSREQVLELLARWLFLFPLQRSEDLVVALAPWCSRATLMRDLNLLETKGLVEWTLAGGTRGKRLYHLSPAGLRYFLAQHPMPGVEEATIVRDTRAEIVRLFPRLSAILPVQDLINGLVAGAAATLTREGRRATLVRWDWQREFTKVFTYRERLWHLRLEGVCSLCLRYDPSQSVSPKVWHTLFVLHTPLQDSYLMRLRLDRFLRWRESPEHWSHYSQMPLLLILADTLRQAEWWQQACVRTAEALRVDVPHGALSIAPALKIGQTVPSPWLMSWRQLGTNQSCHLQEMLPALVQPTFPVRENTSAQRRAVAGKGAQMKSSQGTAVLIGGRRSSQGYHFARRAEQEWEKAPGKLRDVRLASLKLVPRHWDILGLLLHHPLLSRENLCAQIGLQRASLNKILAELRTLGVIESALTMADERFSLTEAGLRLLAASMRCHVRHLACMPEDASELRQWGVRGLRHQIAHTAGIYHFFSMLAQTPHVTLHWWETGTGCERSFAFAGKMHRFRPDALAEISRNAEHMRFWLEWDRGTMTGPGLVRKMATYAEYLTSHECSREHQVLPQLVCVVSDAGQERKLAQAAREGLPQIPKLSCLTTMVSLLNQGIAAPIWLPVQAAAFQESRAPPDTHHRRPLFGEWAPDDGSE